MVEINVCCGSAGKRMAFKFQIHIKTDGETHIIEAGFAYGTSEEDAARRIPKIYKGALKAISAQSGLEYSF